MTQNRIGRMGHQQYARILAAVIEQPRTHEEVAEVVGRGAVSVRQILWRMKQMGVLHVSDWSLPKAGRSIKAAALRPQFSSTERVPMRHTRLK